MKFTDIPHGASVFVDANTLVYHFGPHPTLGLACKDVPGPAKAAADLGAQFRLFSSDANFDRMLELFYSPA